MKKNMIAVATLLMTASFAQAKTVYYPKDACAQIVSQEYSTGGGETTWQMLEILCVDNQGKYTGFVTSWGSAAGFLGFGRLGAESRFEYIPYNGNELKVD